MADETTNAEKNKEVADKLAAQDIAGKPTDGAPTLEAGESLDALLKTKLEEKAASAPPPEPTPEEKAAAEKKAAEEKAAAEAAANTPEARAAAEKKAADEKAAAEVKQRGDELFKDVELPANVKPKSAEAFAAVKIKAASEISRLERERAELAEKLAAAEAKANPPVPEEITKELEEHRQFRAKLDVEADPKFKEFDQQAERARAFIYDQFKKSGKIGDDAIKRIKELGGPEAVNLEKIFESVQDPTMKRLVENKVTEIESIKFNKLQAIEETKSRVQQYLKEREETVVKGVTAHRDATKAQLDGLVAKLPWMKPRDEAAGTPEQIAAAKSDNAFALQVKQELAAALEDDSPEMRAILITGAAQLFRLQRQEVANAAEIKRLNAALTEVTGKYDKIKSASVSRLRESGAAPGAAAVKPADGDFSKPAAQALDEARDRVLAERASKGG